MSIDYNLLTFEELKKVVEASKNGGDLKLADKMADIFIFSYRYFIDDVKHFNNECTPGYHISLFLFTPFENFNQSVKNKIYKKFISEIDLKGYVSLSCLELMQDHFGLDYFLHGPTRKKCDDELYFRISNSTYCVNLSLMDKPDTFFAILTSKEYQDAFIDILQKMIQEYNTIYKKNESITLDKIDPIVKPLDIKDYKKVTKLIYTVPNFYNYVKKNTDKKLWRAFLTVYTCSGISSTCIKLVESIIQEVIDKYFSNDKELFLSLINTKGKSHMSIYFSSNLKKKLRKNLEQSIICYDNACLIHKEKVKKMLGGTITLTKKFRYLFNEGKR